MPILIVYATAAMLFIALFPVPESYRELLNVIAFGTFGWGAFRNFEPLGPMTLIAVVFTMFALLYNPITPVVLAEIPAKALHITGAVLLVVTARRIAG